MSDLRTAAQQALEALESLYLTLPPESVLAKSLNLRITALKAALEQPEQTCNCRWVGDVQTQQCTLHEAHVDAIHEWAERAKAAEAKLAALEQPEQEEYTLVAWFNGKPVYSAPPRCPNCASLEAQNTELDRWGAGYEAGYAAGMAEMKPEQEPVAWMDPNSGEVCRAHWLESHAPERDVDRFSCPLYTHPPRREWRSLSEEEIESLWRKWVGTQRPNYSFTRAVEAALRS
jgi:hypothetical protein